MESKPIKNIIFDIDGTLINSYQASLTTLRDAIKQVTGETLSDDVLYAHFGVPLKDALHIIKIDPKYHEEISKLNDMTYYQNRHLVKVFDGIADMIQTLKERNTPMGLVTSESREEFKLIFQPFPISLFFENYVVADDTVNHKPSGDPLKLFMKRMDWNPEETIYIGDAPYDSLACKDAGIRFALALWGTLKPEIPADYYLKNPMDILELLKLRDC